MSTDNSQPRHHGRSILQSTSIISLGTLSSRILGFFRDILLAKFFGTGVAADALFVAFRIPNMFRDLVGEGATNSAVVPVLSEYRTRKTREEFWHFVSVIFLIALILLSALTLLGIVFAPFLVRLIAPGFMADPYKLDLTVRLTRIMFPYLVFIGLTAYSMAILYTFRSFAAPAFSPCLLNISIIISALFSSRYLAEPVYGLAVGILIGGLLQLLFQMGPLARTGIVWRWPGRLDHPGAAQVGRLLIPRLFGAGVYQLTLFIDTFCASLSAIVGSGGIAAIYYANRVVQFPMGVFGLALASAVLPSLSSLAAHKQTGEMKKTIVFALENIMFVLVPAMIGLMLLSRPIIHVLFERGEFNAYSATITSGALLFYAAGLFSFGGVKIMVTAFHALQDTKTPVKVAGLCLLLNASLNFLLMGRMKVSGIAFASAIAATVNFLWLYRGLTRRLGPLDMDLPSFIPKVVVSSMIAAGCAGLVFTRFPYARQGIALICAGFSGAVSYYAAGYALNIPQTRRIHEWLCGFAAKRR